MSGGVYTPGPWEFNAVTGYVFQRRSPLTIYVIAELQSSEDANGHLLAAAPELLEALEAMVALLDEDGWSWPKQLAEARAAIAKARGDA